MRHTLAVWIAGLGLVLTACGQPATALPTAQPTSSPAPTASPTLAATPTIVPSPSPTTASPSPIAAMPTSAPASVTATSAAPAARVTDTPAAPPAARVTDTPLVLTPQSANGDTIGSLVQRSLAALPQVGKRALTVQSVQAQRWSDSSLGCPDPAAIYLAVITPGFKVALSDGTTTYQVHTNSDGSTLVWCKDGKPIAVPTVR